MKCFTGYNIGKRYVEESVEKQIVSSKKQKTVDDTCDGLVVVEKNKFDTKTRKKVKKSYLQFFMCINFF